MFADVTLNTKNAYLASTGEFTAPVRGHYTFTLTISTTQGALFSTQLTINGNSVCYNHIKGISSGKKTTRSCPQPPLVKWRQMTGVFANKMWSSFSGFIMQNSCSNNCTCLINKLLINSKYFINKHTLQSLALSHTKGSMTLLCTGYIVSTEYTCIKVYLYSPSLVSTFRLVIITNISFYL